MLELQDQGSDTPCVIRPCTVCGGSDRNPSGACRPCQAIRSARWSAKNADAERARKAADYQANRQLYIDRAKARVMRIPDEIRVYKAAWNRANRAKHRTYSANWRARHPEKRKLVVKAWEKRNPDLVRIFQQNRRARVKAARGQFSIGLIPRLWKLQRGLCACCKKPLGSRHELDHIMPLALGGSNTDDNAQLLRSHCNRSKSARHPVDYMQSRGFLL
jgi:5-methylcytosine-specific restriction endonuclease McrA